VIGPEQPGRLSAVREGAEPPRWAPTTLTRLMRALDLRQTGPRQFEAVAAEAGWPAFPGALLVASAVVASERSFPRYSVGHLACSFGRPPRADHPVEAVLCKIHTGVPCITGRLTFRQGGAVHGEVAVMLRPDAAGIGDDPSPRSGPAAPPPLIPAAAAVGEQRPGTPIVPWELLSVPGSAQPSAARSPAAPERDRYACRRDGCSWTWSRARAATPDGTLQRALLAYLSELLPIACTAAAPYPSPAGRTGLSATVLSHAITYGASFDLRDWMLAAIDGPAAGEGYVHALATFRTRQGDVAATASQAAVVWDQEAARGPAGRGRPARHLTLSG
jgi:acyl-CoA thioesterase-2